MSGATEQSPHFGARHFSGLENAKTIKTHQFLMTQRAVDDCTKRRALGVFTGDPGLGKTFAIESATTGMEVPVVRTLFGSQTNKREVARQLLGKIHGVAPRGTYYELSEEVVEAFRDPHVAVIDEAQHLNQDCTFFLRYLLDHPDTNVAILLVGAGGLWRKIMKDPTLQSRVYRRVEFGDVPMDELLKALPKYHPIYAGVDRALLREFLDRCEIASPRALAVFTLTASDILKESGRSHLTEQTIEQSFALITGQSSWQ